MGLGEADSRVFCKTVRFYDWIARVFPYEFGRIPTFPDTIRPDLTSFFDEAKRPDANNPGLKDNAA
jgi:hypothetical protein